LRRAADPPIFRTRRPAGFLTEGPRRIRRRSAPGDRPIGRNDHGKGIDVTDATGLPVPSLLRGLALLAGLVHAATASPLTAQAPDTADRDPEARACDDRMIALVTGSTDGLGREVALRLAAGGAHVIVHGRNRERGMAVVREIEAGGSGSAAFHAADLASLAGVRALGDTILREYQRLDVLVNNAGIWLNDGVRRVSADGHEVHFAVNYLSGVLLTRMLLPRIRASAAARIVNVSSAAQTPLDFEDVMLERGYTPGRAYAQSKLAQILFTFDLARELEGSGVRVNALHPATLMATTLVREAGFPARSTVEEGADAVMNLITSTAVGSGGYYDGVRPARADPQAYDAADRERLRRLTERLLDSVD
jgi:NAD(P)-dependent dehydrogenase (short-subunit alcohol dehydrogenase family)